jgi:peptidoglycan/xylan/chitin deacetylase (PgdA/CDA1 family)
MYLFKTPQLLKFLYPACIWNKSRTERSLYLTFDDGPIPIVTPFVLKTLGDYQAKATFFCIGDNITKHPEIFEEVKNAGHRVANHTFNHLKGWKTPDDIYLENIRQCADLTGNAYFRPPYGRIKRSQLKKLFSVYPEVKVVMWDVLSGDFDQKLSAEKCLKKTIQHTGNGSIIVFHDSIKAFPRLKYVLPRFLKHFSDKGYAFKLL